ncbi:Hypothetical protein ORPV_299 [Orpheovirus IHUMI-LCC2]|uniref:Uncharacterized protein n=1 Tax=Orpheovirus IHUMI-LCC2 TaxID=2023057 RepID=A0A2I2L3V3_9VIRU|nr:Hypothetical protein ORPV_299 [Orpheovirus IHUMI-LCC2]SNW62203.1 Hypothetical protein ORPV_299 [Orpheovirus IHUMI-LCC2]
MNVCTDVFYIIVQLLDINSLISIIIAQRWNDRYMSILYETLTKKIDWNEARTYISMKNGKYYLMDFILEKFRDVVNMELLCKYCEMSEQTIRDHDDFLDFKLLSAKYKYKPYKLSFIREYQLKWDWTEITQRVPMTEKFLLEFRNMVDWDEASEWQYLTPYIIRNNITKLNKQRLYKNRHRLDWLEIEDLIDWSEFSKYVCTYPYLSKSLIDKYINKINISVMVGNIGPYRKIPKESIIEHIKHFYPYIKSINRIQGLSKGSLDKINKYAEKNNLPTI